MDSLDPVEVDDWGIVGDAPCMLKAAGGCDTREAGRQSELQACDAIGDHNYNGDMEHCAT